METKREHLRYKSCDQGNVLIYVLVAVALFAALGFALTQQTRNSGTQELDRANLEFYAMQLIGYAAQVRSVIEQMEITGTSIDEIDFVPPEDSDFNLAPHLHKIYHPEGGGLNIRTLNEKVIAQTASTPPPGWFLGRFNNVEWTNGSGRDVILTAYQISYAVCEVLNEKITGSSTIPALTTNMNDVLVDTSTNLDLTIARCAACEGYTSLCVSNVARDAYSFYTVVGDQ